LQKKEHTSKKIREKRKKKMKKEIKKKTGSRIWKEQKP